jgi:hypothetical protein
VARRRSEPLATPSGASPKPLTRRDVERHDGDVLAAALEAATAFVAANPHASRIAVARHLAETYARSL